MEPTKTIQEIIHAYDWINRDILTRTEFENALNFLLAVGPLEPDNGKFRIPDEKKDDFDVFLERRKRDKFETIRVYFQRLPQIINVPAELRLSDEQCEDYLAEYRSSFRKALGRLFKGRR